MKHKLLFLSILLALHSGTASALCTTSGSQGGLTADGEDCTTNITSFSGANPVRARNEGSYTFTADTLYINGTARSRAAVAEGEGSKLIFKGDTTILSAGSVLDAADGGSILAEKNMTLKLAGHNTLGAVRVWNYGTAKFMGDLNIDVSNTTGWNGTGIFFANSSDNSLLANGSLEVAGKYSVNSKTLAINVSDDYSYANIKINEMEAINNSGDGILIGKPKDADASLSIVMNKATIENKNNALLINGGGKNSCILLGGGADDIRVNADNQIIFLGTGSTISNAGSVINLAASAEDYHADIDVHIKGKVDTSDGGFLIKATDIGKSINTTLYDGAVAHGNIQLTSEDNSVNIYFGADIGTAGQYKYTLGTGTNTVSLHNFTPENTINPVISADSQSNAVNLVNSDMTISAMENNFTGFNQLNLTGNSILQAVPAGNSPFTDVFVDTSSSLYGSELKANVKNRGLFPLTV